METGLHSLAYVSRNRIDGARRRCDEEIDAILAQARINNRRLGVTGALLYNDGCFAQVLEGPVDAVETLFETIQCDPRHGDVAVLHCQPVEARSFATWSMAYVGLPDEAQLPLDFRLEDAAARNGAGEDLVTLLADLVRRHVPVG